MIINSIICTRISMIRMSCMLFDMCRDESLIGRKTYTSTTIAMIMIWIVLLLLLLLLLLTGTSICGIGTNICVIVEMIALVAIAIAIYSIVSCNMLMMNSATFLLAGD